MSFGVRIRTYKKTWIPTIVSSTIRGSRIALVLELTTRNPRRYIDDRYYHKVALVYAIYHMSVLVAQF